MRLDGSAGAGRNCRRPGRSRRALQTERTLLRSVEIAARRGKASRRVVISTATLDRNRRIVEQRWELEAFRANPVLLYGHDDARLPIGSVEGVGVVGTGAAARLEGELAFDTERDFARDVAELWDRGLLSAVSAGWVPVERPVDEFDSESGRYIATRFPHNELVEVSVVPVPANPDALRLAAALGVADRLERLNPTRPTAPGPEAPGALTVHAARRRLQQARLASVRSARATR